MKKDKKPKITKRWIWVTFQKEGIHCYPEAPKGVEFLKHPHRHMFHFNVKIEVTHNDRDIEFILFKRELVDAFESGVLKLDHKSCEMMAEDLIAYLDRNYPGRDIVVNVSEDGENGAELKWKC
jgi:hypothetical protein